MTWLNEEVEALARGEIHRRVEWHTQRISALALQSLTASADRREVIHDQVRSPRRRRREVQSSRSWRFFSAHWLAQLCRWGGR